MLLLSARECRSNKGAGGTLQMLPKHKEGLPPFKTLAGDEDPSFSTLTQAILIKKSLSYCDIPFRFLTVGLTVWERAQTAKVRLDQALPMCL